MNIEFIGALIASVYGCVTIKRKKTPLFYKIVCFAMFICLLGNIYTMLFNAIWQSVDKGFHIGYISYIGMFFFLCSSYYGALNSLVDDGRQSFRVYRIIAGMVVMCFCVAAIVLINRTGQDYFKYIIIIPMGMTLYFAVKHLIITDVEMGIIRVMRLYNMLIIGICICMMLEMFIDKVNIITGILLAICLPVARKGVQKWFI